MLSPASSAGGPALNMSDENLREGILEELTGLELETCLARFLAHIDYLAMGDFFLCFRSYLRPIDLFSTLRNKFETSLDGAPVAGRFLRVRVFVALRHWVLNYYVHDFILASDLSREMEQFLGTLGGVGADEISTESRIAKELRRTWSRQKTIHASIETVKEGTMFDHGNLIRTRHISLPLSIDDIPLSEKVDPSLLESPAEQAPQAAHVTSLVQQIELEIASLQECHSRDEDSVTEEIDLLAAESAKLGERASKHSLTRSPRLARLDLVECAPAVPRLDNSRQGEAQALPTNKSRTLKRKPGGILKNATTIADLIPSVRQSVASVSYNEPTTFLNLNKAFSIRVEQATKPREAAATHKAFVHDLARMFQNDKDDEGQEHSAVVLQDTLARLEGRDFASRKRKSLSDASTASDHSVAACNLDARPGTSSSEKRRKHIGRPELAQATVCVDGSKMSPCQDDDIGPDTPLTGRFTATSSDGRALSWQGQRIASGTTKSLTSDDIDHRPTSSSMVSIIEALAIQPLPSITARNADNKLSKLPRLPYSSFLLQHNEAHITKCLMAAEKAIFLELDWLELSSCSWSSNVSEVDLDWRDVVEDDVSATRLILARVNICTSWIVSEILYTSQIAERSLLLAKLIDVAQLCRDYNNLATLVQIVQALQHPAVRRLTKTWQYLDPETHKTWSRLHGLCDSRGGWRTLKAVQERILRNPDALVVPFLGPYMSDLLNTRVSSQPISVKLQASASTIRILMEMLNRISITDDDRNDPRLIDQLVWIRGIREEEAERLSHLCEA